MLEFFTQINFGILISTLFVESIDSIWNEWNIGLFRFTTQNVIPVGHEEIAVHRPTKDRNERRTNICETNVSMTLTTNTHFVLMLTRNCCTSERWHFCFYFSVLFLLCVFVCFVQHECPKNNFPFLLLLLLLFYMLVKLSFFWTDFPISHILKWILKYRWIGHRLQWKHSINVRWMGQ